MTFVIRNLARMGEFSLDLRSLGTVCCLSLTTDRLSKANKKLASSDVGSLDFVRWLLGEVARKAVDGESPTDGSSLTSDELSAVADRDLYEFADKSIQKNRYLLKTHKGNNIERSADESACDFLVRVFRHHAAEEKMQWDRLTQSASNPLFSNATLESIQRNLGISNQLQDTIDKYTLGHSAAAQMLAEEKAQQDLLTQGTSSSFLGDAEVKAMQRSLGLSDHLMNAIGKFPLDHFFVAESLSITPDSDVLPIHTPRFDFPKNPIHETNAKLESVVNQIEGLRPMAAQAAQLICSMNDAVLRMQADYIENAKTAGRQTRIAIWIAAVSLVVSAIGLAISSFFSYQNYVDGAESAKKSESQIAVLQKEIRDLVIAQREEQAALVKAIVDVPRLPASVTKK